MFGLMHGSLYMLFYTTAFGFALGYIRYATDSLFTVTILHATVNSIGAGALLFTTIMQMTNEENRLINTITIIYLLAMLVLIIVGIVVFISKIPAIKTKCFRTQTLLEADSETLAELAGYIGTNYAHRTRVQAQAALVAGNQRDPACLPALEILAEDDNNPVGMEHARWAISKIRSNPQPTSADLTKADYYHPAPV